MYIKVASILEILMGLVMGGFGGLICLVCSVVPGPTAIFGVIIGMPLIFLSILLIIFGINLLKLKKWAWLPSIIILVLVIAFFAMLGFGHPIYFLGGLGPIICLILLILGRIKKGGISISWKKIIIVALIIAGVTGYYLYRNLQRSEETIIKEETQPSGPEITEYKISKHKIYGYDMLSSLETPLLMLVVFDDQNENGRKDIEEKGLEGIHLDQYWNDEFFGGSMTSENGVVNFFEFPLHQKITISLPTRDNKYWGWRTALKEGWPVTAIDKYEFTLTEIPKEIKTIYFGLKKVEELTIPACQNECSQAGLKRCSDNNYQICGNYDVDICLEWGSIIPCSSEKICENGGCIFKKDTLLLIVEDTLGDGLAQELNTYSDDVKREFGFQTIIKIFPSSASVFEVKSYIKQIYDNQRLNGVLLIGDLPTGKMYHPKGYYSKDNLPLHDYIYQDVYDACKYSEEWDAFDYSTRNCENNQIPPFWVSRLTPNSSSKSSLSLLKDYFKRNHQYRTGQYDYKRNFLIYAPTLLESNLEYRKTQEEGLKRSLREFDVYNEEGYYIIDAEKENSDQLFLNELKKPYQYENLMFNGHGTPVFHQKNIFSGDIINSNFFFGKFLSCSVGRFTTRDYIVGKYLFEGENLAVTAPPAIVMSPVGSVSSELYYLLSLGEPLFEATKIIPTGGANFFGDLTLKMRDVKKPNIYSSNDPIIAISAPSLYFIGNQDAGLKIKNLGKSTLEFRLYIRYYKFEEEWSPTFGYGSKAYVEMNEYGHPLLAPNIEVIFDIKSPGSQGAPSGTYKGEMFLLSNDPVNPYISIPFEAVVQ